jgi:release factor glutamine methyltransferase
MAALREGSQRLAAHSSSAHLDAELLLAHALQTDRTRLKSHPEQVLDADVYRKYHELIERRARGEPLAYLTGFKDFWTLRLAVTPAVLVPRPETELLVERALAAPVPAACRVADLGTGSGAIALALASERPQWQITATDESESALSVARQNARMLGLDRIEWLRGRWFEPLAGRRFNLLVSNPPYIAPDDPALRDPALQYEPQQALVAQENGLAALRILIAGAPAHLERGGWLLLEHGATQGDSVRGELVSRGFAHVRSHRDLAGHERVTEAQWPH